MLLFLVPTFITAMNIGVSDVLLRWVHARMLFVGQGAPESAAFMVVVVVSIE